MSLKNEAVQLQVMAGTQEGGLGDTDLQLQLRDSWRKPRGQEGDRLMVAYIQMTAVNSFPPVTILPRGARGVLAGSALVEIRESLSWPLPHLRLSNPAQICFFVSSEINTQLFRRL